MMIERMRQTDPNLAGEMLMNFRMLHPDKSLHEVADLFDWSLVPEIDKSFSMGKQTVIDYQNELKKRASQGDVFAINLLDTGKT